MESYTYNQNENVQFQRRRNEERGLEYLILKRRAEGNRNREKQWITKLSSEWLTEEEIRLIVKHQTIKIDVKSLKYENDWRNKKKTGSLGELCSSRFIKF